jgi:hypothetical protein
MQAPCTECTKAVKRSKASAPSLRGQPIPDLPFFDIFALHCVQSEERSVRVRLLGMCGRCSKKLLVLAKNRAL